jgi:hypothetical protein
MTGSNGDLGEESCSVDPCSDPVEVLGVAVVGLPPEVGAVEDTLPLTLPLCAYHAHLLRSGVTSFELDSRE